MRDLTNINFIDFQPGAFSPSTQKWNFGGRCNHIDRDEFDPRLSGYLILCIICSTHEGMVLIWDLFIQKLNKSIF